MNSNSVYTYYYIVLLQSGLHCGTTFNHFVNEYTVIDGGNLHILYKLGSELSVSDSEHGTLNGSILLDVGDDLLYNRCGHSK